MKIFLSILFYVSIVLSSFSLIKVIEYSDEDNIFLLIFSIILLLIIWIVRASLETFIKWKAYMLETNYNIYKHK